MTLSGADLEVPGVCFVELMVLLGKRRGWWKEKARGLERLDEVIVRDTRISYLAIHKFP